MSTNYEAYMALFGVKMTNGPASAVFATKAQAEAFLEAFKAQDAAANRGMVGFDGYEYGVEETPTPVTITTLEDALSIMAGPPIERDEASLAPAVEILRAAGLQ